MEAKIRPAIVAPSHRDGDDWRGIVAELFSGAWHTTAWTVFLDRAEAEAWAKGEVDRGAADECCIPDVPEPEGQ